MNRPTITAMNAYKFSDNFTIQTVAEPINVFGCEHNEQEAKALAQWIESENGIKVVVIRNNFDAVRQAKAFRPTPYRFQYRDMAFKEMGVWR